ncbi:uncharacterized protein [Amphiura filiformis]|uniref:uncharacterized protein isoform X2 n=1 Tax=Amphiura filiformis TaxID=82378 RepID=UPI003B21D382
MLQEEIEQIIGRRTHIYRKQGKEWFQCKNCAQKFHKIAELRQHVWIHEGVAPYKCEICGHGSRNMSNLKSHMMRHSDTKTHLCDECGKAFKTKNSLKIHNLSQHANIGQNDTSKMLLMCNLCDFTCVQKSQLKKHWDMHGKIRPYRCGICIQYFCNTKSGLRSHYSKQHPEVEFDETLLQDMQVPEDTDNGSLETITQYKCTQCETVCSSYHILEDHLLKQHNVEIAGTSSEETAAGALIQAAAMAESSSEQVVTGDSDLHIKLPSNSAVQLLQQIINMQGLGHLSSGSESQVQIQLPIPNSMSEATSAGVENSTVPVYAINEDQAMIHAVTEGTTSQSGVSEGQEQEGSSIMQVQFRVEDGEVGQQILSLKEAVMGKLMLRSHQRCNKLSK